MSGCSVTGATGFVGGAGCSSTNSACADPRTSPRKSNWVNWIRPSTGGSAYLSGAELFQQTAHDRALHFEFDDMTLLRYIRWYLRHIGDTGQVDGDIATAV